MIFDDSLKLLEIPYVAECCRVCKWQLQCDDRLAKICAHPYQRKAVYLKPVCVLAGLKNLPVGSLFVDIYFNFDQSVNMEIKIFTDVDPMQVLSTTKHVF